MLKWERCSLYWAPELLQRQRNTAASDVYALVLIFYEIFSRKMIDGDQPPIVDDGT